MDDIIIKYLQRKKNKGLKMLIDQYGGLIVSVVRRHLGSFHMYEEECVDDVLMSVWNHIDSFDRKKNSLKNWIAAIARFQAIDYKRKYWRQVTAYQALDATDVALSNIASPDQGMLQREIEDELQGLLQALSDKDRNIFVQYYIQGISLQEIAVNESTTVDNLYNRLSRGRTKLRNAFHLLDKH